MRLKFDRFVFDSNTQVIHGPNDEKLVMRPQATKVLECLLRHAPDLVSKKDLLNEVWGHEALSESGVAQAIREIRKTLGEQASDPDIVGTRHGCGYYILCDVEILPEALPEVPDSGVGLDGFPAGMKRSASVSRPTPRGLFAPQLLLAVLLPLLVFSGLLNIFSWPGYMFGADSRSVGAHSGPGASVQRIPVVAEDLEEIGRDVAALWERARARRDRLDHSGAIELLEIARSIAPDSPVILLALLQENVEAGYPMRAAELLGEPALQENALSHHRRLMLNAVMERMAGNHSAAADSMQALVALYPENIHFSYALFQDLLRAGFTERAERVLRGIRKHAPDAREDARFWLASFAVSWRKLNISDAIADAELALQMARRAGVVSLEAHAMLALAQVESYLGKIEKAAGLIENARHHFLILNNQKGQIRAWQLQATTLLGIEDIEGASVATDQACRIQQQSMSHDGKTDCLYLQGLVHLAQSDLTQARRLLLDATASPGYSLDAHLAGKIQLALGQLSLISNLPAQALEHFRHAEMRFRYADCRRGLAYARFGMGSSMILAGNADFATPFLQEALAIFQATEDHPGIAKAIGALASVDGGTVEDARTVTLYHSIYGHQSSI